MDVNLITGTEIFQENMDFSPGQDFNNTAISSELFTPYVVTVSSAMST
jgi:hypothetical protein